MNKNKKQCKYVSKWEIRNGKLDTDLRSEKEDLSFQFHTSLSSFQLPISNFFFIITIVFFLFVFSPASVFAAKQRVWKKITTTTQVVTSSKPNFSVKLRSDRRALNVSFSNLQTTTSTSYELTYSGNELDQGVVGSTNTAEGNSTTRLLLFGTCSKNVCTYHRNISGMQLTITSKLNNGKTLIKRYKVKP